MRFLVRSADQDRPTFAWIHYSKSISV